MPNVAMKRVICHWTGGRYRASDLDKMHYHILIEKDGKLVRGVNSIADNVSTADGKYAAHTLGVNTGSIGVSMCAMGGDDVKERPFSPGQFPLLEVQWTTMAKVVAELCQFYRIPVTPQTVLGHGEVQANLGKPQKQKWDPMVLPWQPDMSRTQVGIFLRSLVQNFIERGPGEEEEEVPASVTILIRGKKITDAFIANENAFVNADALEKAFGWTVTSRVGDDVSLDIEGKAHTLPFMEREETVYVGVRELVAALGGKGSFDPATRTVTIP
jgi:hypothetical protein